MEIPPYVITGLLLIIGLSVGRCSRDATAQEKAALSITCTTERSEVKWFYGEICPIDKNGYVSVGLNMSGSNRTIGCVTIKNYCEVRN